MLLLPAAAGSTSAPTCKLLGITPGLNGGFAEQVVLTGELLRNGIVHRMPEGLSFHEGGLAETLSSVLASHHKCQTSLGETVVVLGAGPIGCLHLVIAQARGARVIVAEPNPARRQRARAVRAGRHHRRHPQDVVAEVQAADGRAWARTS